MICNQQGASHNPRADGGRRSTCPAEMVAASLSGSEQVCSVPSSSVALLCAVVYPIPECQWCHLKPYLLGHLLKRHHPGHDYDHASSAAPGSPRRAIPRRPVGARQEQRLHLSTATRSFVRRRRTQPNTPFRNPEGVQSTNRRATAGGCCCSVVMPSATCCGRETGTAVHLHLSCEKEIASEREREWIWRIWRCSGGE